MYWLLLFATKFYARSFLRKVRTYPRQGRTRVNPLYTNTRRRVVPLTQRKLNCSELGGCTLTERSGERKVIFMTYQGHIEFRSWRCRFTCVVQLLLVLGAIKQLYRYMCLGLPFPVNNPSMLKQHLFIGNTRQRKTDPQNRPMIFKTSSV